MARQKTLTIGRPFDARHVSGVGIPGTTIPMNNDIQRSLTSGPELNSTPPPPPPLPTNISTFTTQSSKISPEDLELMPKRANTVHSHDDRSARPGLRLQRSFSRLTRSVSKSRSRSAMGNRDEEEQDEEVRPKQKESSNRFSLSRSRSHSSVSRHNYGYGVLNPYQRDYTEERNRIPNERPPTTISTHAPSLPIPDFNPNSRSSKYHYPSTSISTSISTHTTPPPIPTYPNNTSYHYPSTSISTSVSSSPSSNPSHSAMHLTSIPTNERPLGFREIMAVQSFNERMALYKRTREYWARADHGLGEWVGKARVGGGGMDGPSGPGGVVMV